MQLREIMTSEPFCAAPDMSVKELTRELVRRRESGAPVVDSSGNPVGVVSLVDVAVHSTFEPSDIRLVREVMQSSVIALSEDAGLLEAVELILTHRIHRVVITSEQRVTGVVTAVDVIGALLHMARPVPE